MPVIPILQSRLERQAPRVVVEPADPFSGIQRALDLADKVNEAYNESEATRIAGGAAADLDGALKIADAQYGNPDEFSVNAAQKTQEIIQKARASAPNHIVRQKIEAKLADNIHKAEANIVYGGVKKKIDVAQGNWEQEKADATKQFAELDDAGKEQKLIQMKARSEELAKQGVLDNKQAKIDVLTLEKNGWREDAALFASKAPIAFQDAVDSGRYRGKLSGTDLQTAQDIAERTIRAQDAKDARFTAAQGRVAEKEFYDAAKAKKLDESELLRAQSLYGWSKEKVDSIMRVQLGVKEANPYSDQLIAQAARLDDPIYPTTQMVQNAQARLDRLVESGKVGRDSVEYQRATRELRIIAQIAARSNSPENQEKGKAKTFIRDLLNSQAPDMEPEEKRKILGDYFTEINKAQGIQALQAIKDRFEKQITQKQKIVDPSKDAADRLRGLTR
jgi:hypothetical protein